MSASTPTASATLTRSLAHTTTAPAAPSAPPAPPAESPRESTKLTADMLIEEVSIDGMCGVY